MELEFEQQVLEFVRAQGLFAQDEGVMIAVSGGADSTALMVMMNRLRERHLVGERLICVHVHHGLRAEQADADEAFARETANRFAMQFVKRAVDVKGCAKREKMSIETAGRRLRLEVMEEVARQTGCSCVVTGHHKDDCAETMIQRLSRGTGYRGLCGIRPST